MILKCVKVVAAAAFALVSLNVSGIVSVLP